MLNNKKNSWEKDFICYKYNYILKYLNIIKVNFKIKNIVATKIVKKYYLSDISKNIKNVK